MQEDVNATGTLEAKDLVFVAPSIAGEVVWIAANADFSRPVKKNEILVRLDSKMARAKLGQALAELTAAKAAKAQAEDHLKAAVKELGYQEKFDKSVKDPGSENQLIKAQIQKAAAETGLQVADAKIQAADQAKEQAQLNLDWTTIKAPADGTIVDRKVHMGQVVGPTSQPLFTIAEDLDHLELH